MSARSALALASLLSFHAGCTESDALQAGDGVRIREQIDRSVVELDPARVPVTADCAPGSVLVHQNGAWTCPALDSASIAERLAQLEALAARIDALETRTTTLADALASARTSIAALSELSRGFRALLDDHERKSAERPLSLPAAACIPDDTAFEQGLAAFSRGAYTVPQPSAFELVLNCPLLLPSPAPRWNSATHVFRDPDGLGADAYVSSALWRTDGPPDRAPPQFNSSRSILTSTQSRPSPLYDPVFAAGTGAGHYDFAELHMHAPGASLFGLRLEARAPIAPPSLAAPGGELDVNGGYPADLTDAQGRVWYADENYLVPGHAATRTQIETIPIDQHLLHPADVPNEMLASERWCECNLSYQMAVPDGEYSVTVYFSENCLSCAGTSIGGTSPELEPCHSVGVHAQDMSVAGYPPGFTAGAMYTATQLDFQVGVTDGLLNISVDDLGHGWPCPGDSMMKGFKVRRTR